MVSNKKTKLSKSSKSKKGTSLDELAKELSEKYGFDVATVLQMLLEYGPKIVEMVLALFKKVPKTALRSKMSAHFVADLEEVISLQMEAVAQSLCLKCCMEHCANDDENDEDDEEEDEEDEDDEDDDEE